MQQRLAPPTQRKPLPPPSKTRPGSSSAHLAHPGRSSACTWCRRNSSWHLIMRDLLSHFITHPVTSLLGQQSGTLLGSSSGVSPGLGDWGAEKLGAEFCLLAPHGHKGLPSVNRKQCDSEAPRAGMRWFRVRGVRGQRHRVRKWVGKGVLLEKPCPSSTFSC